MAPLRYFDYQVTSFVAPRGKYIHCDDIFHKQIYICIVNPSEMTEQDKNSEQPARVRTIKDLANTPFKRAMLVVQVISYVLIVGSPFIGGALGRSLGLKAAQTGGVILGIFIAGEVLFYASLAFLGKEVVLLIRDKMKGWFKRKNRSKE